MQKKSKMNKGEKFDINTLCKAQIRVLYKVLNENLVIRIACTAATATREGSHCDGLCCSAAEDSLVPTLECGDCILQYLSVYFSSLAEL